MVTTTPAGSEEARAPDILVGSMTPRVMMVRSHIGLLLCDAERTPVALLGVPGTGDVPTVTGPVYITIDIDALDPAFAPGVSHHEPGGLSTRQLLDSLRQIGASDAVVVGADVVELNPTRDVNEVTAMVAAKLVRELLGLLIESAS